MDSVIGVESGKKQLVKWVDGLEESAGYRIGSFEASKRTVFLPTRDALDAAFQMIEHRLPVPSDPVAEYFLKELKKRVVVQRGL